MCHDVGWLWCGQGGCLRRPAYSNIISSTHVRRATVLTTFVPSKGFSIADQCWILLVGPQGCVLSVGGSARVHAGMSALVACYSFCFSV